MNIFKVIFMGLLFFIVFTIEASAYQRYQQGNRIPIDADIIAHPGLWLSNPCGTDERPPQGHLSASLCESATTFSPTLFLDRGVCTPGIRVQQGSLICQEVNYNPNANAGVDQEVTTGSTVSLNGSASSDTNSGDTLSFSWQIIVKPEGSLAILSGTNTAFPTFTADVNGVYLVRLTVNDTEASDTDEVSITATTSLPADTTPPLIILNGNNPEIVLTGTHFEDPGATAQDNRDGSVPVETNGHVNTSIAGSYIKNYRATDSAGNRAETNREVQVVDSLSLIARDDDVEPTTIETVQINVLANDTYSDSTIRVALEYYEPTQGTWSVVDNQVTFAPNTNFGGGKIEAAYRIIDSVGNTATAYIYIHYPAIFEANNDTESALSISPVTVDVLSNDTTIETSPVTVKIKTWEGSTYSILPRYNGTWEVTDNNVTFTPNENFHGGDASIEYEITDTEDHLSSAEITIHYPVLFTAIHDYVVSETLVSVDIDALENDIFSTPTIILNVWPDTYSNSVWEVIDNQIRFTPDTNFLGGDVWAEYAIQNDEGIVSISTVRIGYPIIFRAYGDKGRVENIQDTATVDVLQNDITIEGLPTTVTLISWDNVAHTQVFVDHVLTEDGEWNVIDGNVTFTPSSNFGGGSTYMQYHIIDSAGHESKSGITLHYPAILLARQDQKNPTIIEETTIAVLDNDSYSNDTVINIMLKIYDYTIDTYRVTDHYETEEGNWSVVDNQVIFTPSESFGGGFLTGVSYVLTDTEGHSSTASIELKYPYIFHAVRDYAISSTFDPLTLDIVENDITVPGLPVTVSDLAEATEEGNWSIDGYNVTFTPSATFAGGTVSKWYEITDAVGHHSDTGITIEYPIILEAHNDDETMDTIVSKQIAVLENDTLPEEAIISIALKGKWTYNPTDDTWEEPWVNSRETAEGNWSVTGNEVLFTPKSTFGGGDIYAQYQISDQDGHTSSTWISVNYPVVLRAQDDSVQPATRAPVIVPVLANDTIAEGSIVTVQIAVQEWNATTGTSYYQYVDNYQSYEGNWTVIANEVLFTPNGAWEGKYANIKYQITNQDNITSSADISIELPALLYAESDNSSASDIAQTVVVPVLDNDTAIDGKENLTLQLQYQDENWNTVYGSSYENGDGTWNVLPDNTIEFIPSATFGGGYVSATYQITDLHGRTAETNINIEFPTVIYAEYDETYPTVLTLETIDVLANDTYDRAGSPITVMLVNNYWDETGNHTEYATFLESYEGNWTVTASNEIEFTPKENFTGTYVSATYQITQDGRTSTTSVSITYPIIIQASDDYVSPAELTETIVDVLSNDIIVNGLDRLELFDWDNGIFVTSYTSPEGNWSITLGNEVSFFPSSTFGGGHVQVQYQITDTLGNTSQTWVNIDFPVVLHAEYDNIQPGTRDPVTVLVLDNDTIAEGSAVTITFDIEEWDPETGTSTHQYVDSYESYEGNWTVIANEVLFTPNEAWNGRYVRITYQITNQDNITSSADISIELPALLYAESDNSSASDIAQTVVVPVLDNDTAIDGKENLTLQLQYQDENWNTVYGSSYENGDGTWNVLPDNTIEFIPSATFGGGYVSATYQITDLHGRTAETNINIEFPTVIYAEYDEQDATILTPETIDVLANDTYNRAGSLILVMLENNYWDETGNHHIEYVTLLEKNEGNWTVNGDNTIEFTPKSNFTGTYVQATYQITQDGRTSTTSVSITYPIIIQASYDYVYPTEIIETTVDVLSNDIIANGLDRLELFDWMVGEVVTFYETAEGNWSITLGNEVSFVPSSTFGGGHVQVQYQITDTLGNTSQTWVNIDFPVVLHAEYDSEQHSGIEAVEVAVLNNDTILDGPVTILVQSGYDGDANPTYAETYEDSQGVWSITGGGVTFTPNVDFSGGYIGIQYQITDQSGRTSSNSIGIEYL